MSDEVYLAARYSRRTELLGYASALEALGFAVPARWLRVEHDLPLGWTDDDERAGPLAQGFARDDFEDLLRARLVIAFTEPPGERSGRGRGGRHVELGLALAWEKPVIVVGYRENVFCWLPEVEFFPTWDECHRFIVDAFIAGIRDPARA